MSNETGDLKSPRSGGASIENVESSIQSPTIAVESPVAVLQKGESLDNGENDGFESAGQTSDMKTPEMEIVDEEKVHVENSENMEIVGK